MFNDPRIYFLLNLNLKWTNFIKENNEDIMITYSYFRSFKSTYTALLTLFDGLTDWLNFDDFLECILDLNRAVGLTQIIT